MTFLKNMSIVIVRVMDIKLKDINKMDMIVMDMIVMDMIKKIIMMIMTLFMNLIAISKMKSNRNLKAIIISSIIIREINTKKFNLILRIMKMKKNNIT